MTKLIAYLIPGLILILVFSLLKAFVFPIEVTLEPWFVDFNFLFFVACVVVPSVIYYLRTPPGIDHRE